MRSLHFDCFSGISGDMTVAALLDAGVPESLLQQAVGSLGLPGTLIVEKVRKNGFAATQVRVDTPHEHKHRHLHHIRAILDKGVLTTGARQLADRMFARLAEAEAAAHGIPVEKVHFHEVGAIDSIFDFVAIATGIDHLKVERVTSSPVPTGHGTVTCEHGTLPVPAPAVARLLQGVPLAGTSIEAELTTPTGAAVLVATVHEYTPQPAMTIQSVGYGAGRRDFKEQPNLLRILIGESDATASSEETDVVWQVETNLDDLPAEILGYCSEQLFALGALDVFTVPIQMKKSRPGVLLCVLCSDATLPAVERVIFQETATFGVRKRRVERSKLRRETATVQTALGPVQGKLGWNTHVRVFSPEHADCVRVAREQGVPLRTVYELASRAYRDSGGDNNPGQASR